MSQDTAPTPFRIDVPQETLDDLQSRLQRARWPSEIGGTGWDYGMNLTYLQELTAYWEHGFDWRAQEMMLNGFAHFRADVGGQGVHFIHGRGQGPNPLPLLLTHGWPDSFYRFYKLIPLLTDPARFGGDASDAFDVVVPSIPGFGFSDRLKQTSATGQQIADLLARLMTHVLGYGRFAAHAGDIGRTLTEHLALRHAPSLVGIHLTDLSSRHLATVPPEQLSAPEQQYLLAVQAWQAQEGAYAHIQATVPQTAAYGLNDSPVGLAAWIVEKFRAWSDCGDDVERHFTKDELLTNVMIYWATQTIGSSFLPYVASLNGASEDAGQRTQVPTGVALFPADLVPPPREYGERFFNIQRWTEMPRGGHFAALEDPELLAEELRTFFRPLRG